MIREITKDQFVLSQVSQDASITDMNIANDLLDTVYAHQESCVGMAANMIGILKNIIVFQDTIDYTIMFNPKILKASDIYHTQEGCLCHLGVKDTKRYKKIKVEYYDIHFKKKIKTYTDDIAQIIQHEIDHCHGILI